MAKTTKFTLPEIGLSASTKLPKTKKIRKKVRIVILYLRLQEFI